MTTPAGWYPDPTADGQQRYWDGTQWTEYSAPLVPATGTDPAAGADVTQTAAPLADATAPTVGATSAADSDIGASPADGTAAEGPRSRGKIVGGIAAGILVLGAGAFAATQLAGADGGADSPEAAVSAMFGSISDEDVVGMAEVVLPGERRTYIDPLLESVEHLQRWGVLDDALDTSDVAGVDLEVEGLEMRVEEVSDDIVNVYASGTLTASVDGESLPVGDLLSERALQDQDMSELDEEADSEEFDDVRITAVREDGRWYVSAMFTVAETAREEMGALPIHADDGVQPIGAGSPEEAIDGMIGAIEDLDVEGIIARLNPDEAAALQRYAPLFLDEAQAELDTVRTDSGLEFSIDDVEYDVTERDGFAIVVPRSFSISGSDDTGAEFSMAMDEDGCVTVTADDETEELCDDVADSIDLTDTPVGDVEEIFADMDPMGLVVVEHDGEWFVSPIRSYTEALLGFMRAIEREDLERLLDAIEDGSLEAWLEDELGEVFEEAFAIEGFEELGGGSGEWSEFQPSADLETLVADCEAGDMEACDDLYWESGIGTDEELIGETCGNTLPAEPGTCVERTEGGNGSTTDTTIAAGQTYGDDPELDALWDACAAGDGIACDDLYSQAPYDSEYERFGQSCGNREPDDNVDWCEDLMAADG